LNEDLIEGESDMRGLDGIETERAKKGLGICKVGKWDDSFLVRDLNFIFEVYL
jgi:hypothetical protein